MENNFKQKSYEKSKTIRKIYRQQMFQRNRNTNNNQQNYLKQYNQQTQIEIKYSQQGSLPISLPSQTIYITPSTISFYRRAGKPIFKTRINSQHPHDPHMTFESLYILAGIDSIQNYQNPQNIIKQFEDNLSIYLTMPYNQIKQMSIIAAGNKILGKQSDIMNIVNSNYNQLWVLINHIYSTKISYIAMFKYLNHNLPIIYRTIYEMTNVQKDQIIQSITKDQQIMGNIIKAMWNRNEEIQLYSIGIIGNILAQRDEDYSELLTKFNILDKVFPLLKSSNANIKKDTLWLLSNYIMDNVSANQMLCKMQLIQKLLMLYYNQQSQIIKIQIYYVFYYLSYFGDKQKVYLMALQQRILDQCLSDIQVYNNQQLTYLNLSLISKLFQISQQFNYDENSRNPIIDMILSSQLLTLIRSKTYSPNQQISNISFDIMKQVQEYNLKF